MARTHRLLLGLLAAPVVLYAGACAILFATQRSHLYFPVPRGRRDVDMGTLRRADATLVLSLRELEGTKAVVYYGGNHEDVSQTVPVLAEAYPDRAIYALHYRGYGGSTGTPTEANNIADGLALFDQVCQLHPEIVVVGRSLGSGVAVQVAARRRAATHLVLVTPYDSVVNVAAHHYPDFPVRRISRDRYESWRHAPAIDVPTTLIVAGRDRIIPRENTRKLYSAFRPGIAKWIEYPLAVHSFPHDAKFAATLRAAVQ
jgi:uncharacterized protein